MGQLVRRRAQVIPTAAARRRSAAPTPTAMTRPREEADEDSEAAASAVVPEAGSSACEGVGVMVKGLMGAGKSMKGPTVPRSKEPVNFSVYGG